MNLSKSMYNSSMIKSSKEIILDKCCNFIDEAETKRLLKKIIELDNLAINDRT